MAMNLSAALTVPYRLHGRPAFDRIMDAWQEGAPELLPMRADSIEPVRRPFDLADCDDAFKSWGLNPWIARRTKPTMETNILSALYRHSVISGTVERGDAELCRRLSTWLGALAAVTDPHYGMVHALTQAEIDEARELRRPDLMVINRVTGRSTLGVGFTRQLEHGIPSLYWQNVFGPPYIELFGRARLLAAPAAIVDEKPWGIVVQLTDDPPTDASWADYRERRERLADHLGREAFWPLGERVPSAMRDFEPPPLAA